MKKLTITTILIILSMLIVTQLFSKEMAKKVEAEPEKKPEKKSSYTIEETTEIMRSSKLGNIKLDHDDHVYKCMKLSKEGKDLEGAVQVLVSFKTNIGYTLDDDEVDMIIRISKVDTNLYNDIALASKKIGKQKTTVREHFTIVKELESGNGKYLLLGLERANMCGYKIENDYYSWKRLNLLIQVGKLEDENRFMNIYTAMKSVGMGSKVNSIGLEVLYKLYHLKGDVGAKIAEYLKVNKWKSRKQPGKREYQVIADLMKANYSNYSLSEEESKKKVENDREDTNRENIKAEEKEEEEEEEEKKVTATPKKIKHPSKKRKTYSSQKKKRKVKSKVKPKEKSSEKSKPKKTRKEILKPCSPKLTKN